MMTSFVVNRSTKGTVEMLQAAASKSSLVVVQRSIGDQLPRIVDFLHIRGIAPSRHVFHEQWLCLKGGAPAHSQSHCMGPGDVDITRRVMVAVTIPKLNREMTCHAGVSRAEMDCLGRVVEARPITDIDRKSI